MTPQETMALARGAGIELELVDGRLKLRGDTAPPAALLAALRENRDAVLALLRIGPDGRSGEFWASLLDEFTSVALVDGLPPDEAAKVAWHGLLQWWADLNLPQYAPGRLADAESALAEFGLHGPAVVTPVAPPAMVVRIRARTPEGPGADWSEQAVPEGKRGLAHCDQKGGVRTGEQVRLGVRSGEALARHGNPRPACHHR